MVALPFRRIILYKHGVGYFERRGKVSGEAVRLTFPRAAMDDVLKSLVALDMSSGQVLSVDFETPEDRDELLSRGSIHLSDNHSLLDLLRDLRGRQVRCVLDGDDEADNIVEGQVVGVDYENEKPLGRTLVAIYQPDQRHVRSLALNAIARLDLLDDTASSDLSYFLRAAQSEADRCSANLHLSPGDHDLLVGYIAPAPAWRVSYRMLYEAGDAPNSGAVLLQGWGLFDNQLEEDLEQVRLTLVAGMPVSFRYRLYEPKTPERPLVEDEERTVNAPVFFESAPPVAPAAAMDHSAGRTRAMKLGAMETEALAAADMQAFGIDQMEEAVQVSAIGGERGALFAYEVSHPVSVARGQSAMAPILSQKLESRRELLYNGRKLPKHPVASLRLQNSTGLTLERGPATVLENGDYAGEAVLPFTRADGELIVPYAVELGITVEEQTNNTRQIAGIHVRGEYLQIQEYVTRHTSYHLTSTLSTAADVVIEHVPAQNYELFDTSDPAERGAAFLRWNVACAPNVRTVFDVRERRLTSRREEVSSLNGARLNAYLRDKFLDKATTRVLEDVLNLYRQIGEQQQQIAKGERDRDAVYKKQRQIQGNLGPLGREGDEGALRARYVAELNTLEDRLKEFATIEQRSQQAITRLEQQIQAQLRKLTE